MEWEERREARRCREQGRKEKRGERREEEKRKEKEWTRLGLGVIVLEVLKHLPRFLCVSAALACRLAV